MFRRTLAEPLVHEVTLVKHLNGFVFTVRTRKGDGRFGWKVVVKWAKAMSTGLRGSEKDNRRSSMPDTSYRNRVADPAAIGLTESEVRGILGTPTAEHHNTLVFDHKHQETIHNEPFSAWNTVAVELRSGVVWSIQVWKTTSN